MIAFSVSLDLPGSYGLHTCTDKKKSMCNVSLRLGLENRMNFLFKTYDLYQLS